MKKALCAFGAFCKREVVLCAAVALAVISMFIVPPSAAYLGYVDWNTIAQLFSLMLVMKGFQSAGLFSLLAGKLLKMAGSTRTVMLVLVLLPFFLSMLITNDVALITFVPFALTALKMAGRQKLAVPLVIMQTLAANLGSMLTPMGNPQNLYLFARSGMSLGHMMGLMLPYCALSAAVLVVAVLCFKSAPAACTIEKAPRCRPLGVIWPSVGFALCMLALFNVLPCLLVAGLLLVFVMAADIKVLARVDYCLLATFVALFIFIGNIGSLEGVRTALSSLVGGSEVVVSVLASQVISNVPAALLLSGFSSDWPALIIGCNLGGLGTLIASMASLISFKEISRGQPDCKAKYIGLFTLANVVMLGLLLGLYYILKLFA